MSELIAKPIVKNHAGYGVQVNGTFLQFNNKEEIKKKAHIKFQPLDTIKIKPTVPYPEYPTTSRVYNSVCDITRGLHLFTTTRKSKCLHAAGYFVIDQNGTASVQFCPKYIFIQRYAYSGPYKTLDEAKRQINT
jgi:hypothetical protein